MAMKYIDPIRSEDPERFDLKGLLLAGIGLAGIAFGLSVAGLNLLPWSIVAGLVAIGSISMTLYVVHFAEDGIAGAGLCDAAATDPARRHHRRFPVPARHRRAAVFAAAVDAGRFWPLPVPVGPRDLLLRGRRHGQKTLAARIIRTFGFRNMMTINAVRQLGLPSRPAHCSRRRRRSC